MIIRKKEKWQSLGNEFTDASLMRMLEIRRAVVSPICNQLGVPLQVNLQASSQ